MKVGRLFGVFVTLCILAFLQTPELVGAQATSPSPSPQPNPSTSNAYLYEVKRLCGRETLARIVHLEHEAYIASTAAEQAKEKALSTELIEVSRECTIELSDASEEAKLWMESNVLLGLTLRFEAVDSTDQDDFFTVLGKLALEVVVVCRSPLIVSPGDLGSQTRLLIHGEFDRMTRFGPNFDFTKTPYGPYLDDLRSCATRIGYEKQF